MSGGSLPKTGIALGGTIITVGGYHVSGLIGVIIAAAIIVAFGALLLRLSFRRGQQAPIIVGGGDAMAAFGDNDETAVVPKSLLRRSGPGARNR